MNDRFQLDRPFHPFVNLSDGMEEVGITRSDPGRTREGAVGQRSLVVVDYVVCGLDMGRECPIQMMVAMVELDPFISWARNRRPRLDQNNRS
jgi:hypothetical protein